MNTDMILFESMTLENNSGFVMFEKTFSIQFANENNIPFLDHWIECPDYTIKEILEYLTEESLPMKRT